MTVSQGHGPPPPSRHQPPPKRLDDPPLHRYIDDLRALIEAGKYRDRRFYFYDFRYPDYLPIGQWLLAMEHCQEGHDFYDLGDPCVCGSDNCAACGYCGYESHD